MPKSISEFEAVLGPAKIIRGEAFFKCGCRAQTRVTDLWFMHNETACVKHYDDADLIKRGLLLPIFGD